ncbi:LTA synthase family protein [Massilibacteroides sp.]|uniref:LTA synthase family protein n=1 Tax=Massilibacteroides sp. TaxID=2034766 RepID=UPI002602B57C|nr:LTA synthase family protein [Massilibacteroides sp.]MDD4514844.1 LTA synthase family protein [Massilibacteroides sp.]
MKKRVLFLVCVFFTWILVFAIQKPLFLLYHHELAGNHSFWEFLQVVLNGLKLDMTMAGYLTVIPLLLTIASIWIGSKWIRTTLKVYFAIIAIIIALIFTVDEALYGYWKFRLDSTVFFYLESPANAMASVPILTFLVQFVVTIIYAVLIYWLFNRFVLPILPKESTTKKWQTLAVSIVLGGLMFIAIRGGVTTSTANVGMVYFSKDQFLNHAAINPCFSLLTSFSKQQDFSSQFQFFSEEKREALFSPLYPKHTATPDSVSLLKTKQPNILIVILEGFSANVVEVTGGEKGITPNLNRLSKESVLFRNMYANSFRTDRGLVAALNGYLAQPTTSIMKYPSKSQTLPSIALSLREKGYSTDVLYGGDINFTNMRSFFYNSGYNRLTSDVDFPISSRLSKWGANDDVTFEHLYDDILNVKEKQSPWFCTFLTLSSHEPFKVPYQRLDHPYLNSVAFTDSCIGNFVDKIKETPAWKDLLIVFVSDHGFRYPETLKEYEPGRYHIPCIWIGGAIKEPVVINKLVNQTDIAATLLKQLDIVNPALTFSRDIFSPDYPESIFYSFNNGFGVIDSTGASVYDNTTNTPLMEQPQTGSNVRLEKGKAILQTLYQDLGNR